MIHLFGTECFALCVPRQESMKEIYEKRATDMQYTGEGRLSGHRKSIDMVNP